MGKNINIAIDGPSGAGKSTVARELAKRLGYIYLDTGALYRAVGYYASVHGIDPKDEEALKSRFSDIRLSLEWKQGTQRILLNGEDVSEEIRLPEMSMSASSVSALPAVREFLLEMQRQFAREHDVIMDGRDIGTVVLPNADVKIFMTADPNIRAKRRYDELIQKGKQVTYDEVYADMMQRDKNDSTRKTAPCIPAKDAIVFDNGPYELNENITRLMSLIEEKLKR